MVVLYVRGKSIGTATDADSLVAACRAQNERVDVCDEAGNRLGTFTPEPVNGSNEPLIPWEPDITPEEIERRFAEPGLSYDEVRKRLGWA